MNAKKFSEAMGEIDSKYIESAMNYRPKQKMHNWFKWGAMAACLCLICIVAFPLIRKEQAQPAETDYAIAPNFILNGIRYFETPYPIAFEKCPDGFEYGGVIESGVVEGNSYYVNPQMPEWVYVERGTKRIDTVDDFYTGYVRYVDERIRGKKFINYDSTIYVSMSSVDVLLDVDESLYDEIRSTYGLVIEALSVDGFQFVGTTNFEGFDVVPYYSFGSNTHQKEEQIYVDPNDENVILLSTSWETSSGTHEGFDVYIKSNYNYARHENICYN